MSFYYARRYRGPLQAALLDWAGTTVDYGSCAPARVFIEVFQKKGIDLTSSQAREPMGLDKKMHIEALLKMEDISTQWLRKFGRHWNTSDIEDLYKSFVPLQLNCLRDYSQLIPGTLDSVQEMKRRGFKIGTTTGYSADMIGIVASEAKKQGFDPDSIICSSDVFAGRPHPWMAFESARRLQVYPLESYVKIGDTVADVEEGLNAGMWTIGLARTGNELGLTENEIQKLEPRVLGQKLDRARQRLLQSGAHYVVEGMADILPILDLINSRLVQGEKP